MKNLTALLGLAALLIGQLSVANTLILPSFFEPDLMGVLDDEFGLASLQRIDDDIDQYWTVTGDVSATAVAKHAGYSQNFGLLDGSDNFSSLLYAPYMDAQHGSSDTTEEGLPIRFGLTRGAMPLLGNKPLFSSDASDNAVCNKLFCTPEYDHMVSWLITDGDYAGDYVLAWEDLKFLGDRDYNDLVVRVSGVSPDYFAGGIPDVPVQVVPVPAAAWLFGSGLIGLAVFARRRI